VSTSTALPADSIPVVCAGVVVADHLCTPIQHMPAAGELVPADDLILNIGGCASNAAIALGRLGVHALVCGRVGNDILGRFVAETLDAEGVDTGGLLVDPERATSQSLIINVRGQDRRFIHSFGANRGLSAADLGPMIERGPKILYLGGYGILPGMVAEDLAARFAEARRRGIVTILDVAVPGPGDHARQLAAVLPEVDVFLPNGDEAAVILGESDPIKQARAFRAMGARRVVITRGEHGAVALSDDLEVQLGTYAVPFVDASGGGDAFDAGYIAGLLDGLPELECLKFASAIGASCVRAVGTTAGIFSRAEALEFIANNQLAVTPL